MRPIDRLLQIMERLRDPQDGCPWDVEQTFETIAPYTIEEAYEVDDAIRSGDLDAIRDELGDLLLQVVFHARMAEEQGSFGFDDVATSISDKLVSRHPHVFGDESARAVAGEVTSARDQSRAWERSKARERARAAERDGRRASVLDGVPLGLPALLRAGKLIRRAARAGFEWPDASFAFGKVAEELEEVRVEAAGSDRERLREELGDLLIASCGLAHALEVDAEQALREASAKFESRLRRVEAGLADEGRRMDEVEIEELLRRWERAKRGGGNVEGEGGAW